MIKILEKRVADKIAAGEVVDRPLSVVKELVENAIDAGATSIICEIQKGGKSYIRVTDNGHRISSEQVETAFLRHATSKIAEAEDLDHIGTLGFRGEALASIAAVSGVEMITRTGEEKVGAKLVVEGGQIVAKEPTGCEEGTTIIVQDLFYNTPARLKFMKSDATESTLIVDFFSRMALAYPHIKMRMINNRNILFSTRGDGDRWRTILTVGGANAKDELLPVNGEDGDRKLMGYISPPGESRASRRNQIFFVNGRTVTNKTMEKALDGAYKERLFHQGRYPIAYLFLEVAPETLDVNIHPNKREVRFHDDVSVAEFIKSTVEEALKTKEAMPRIQEKSSKVSRLWKLQEESRKAENIGLDEDSISRRETGEVSKAGEQVDVKQILSTFREENQRIAEEAGKYQASPPPKANVPFRFEDLTVLGVLFSTYIMLRDEDTFYLVDQHAAHERIYFEKIMDSYRSGDAPKQEIMVPITFDVPFFSDEWKEALERFGFSIREFGPQTYAAHGIPIFMDLSGGEKFILDFMDGIGEDTDFESEDVVTAIAQRACKQAVKAGDELSSQEAEQLIRDLSQCRNPFSCPHGRPTFIRMTRQEMERKFKRT